MPLRKSGWCTMSMSAPQSTASWATAGAGSTANITRWTSSAGCPPTSPTASQPSAVAGGYQSSSRATTSARVGMGDRLTRIQEDQMTLTEETAEAQPRPAYPSRSARAWRIAALVAVLVAVAAHVWVAASALHKGFPTFSYDEIDTLLVGRAALGIPSPQVAGAGYFPLSSILVSPVWWITSDPFVFYRVA